MAVAVFNRHAPPSLQTLVTEIVLLLDAGIGLAWMFGAPARTSTPTFHVARVLLGFLPGDPIRWWAGILLILAAAAMTAMTRLDAPGARRCIALLVPFWAFFTLMYASAIFTAPNASIAAPLFTTIVLVGHVRPLLTVDLVQRR